MGPPLVKCVSWYKSNMEINKPTLDERVAALRLKINDQFSGWTIEGALRALADNENPLRLNLFSTAMRIRSSKAVGD